MARDTPKISHYALIGNSCSAALVSRYGSIDWCCLPEFDSPSIFAALLDARKGGHFSISPVEESRSVQKYLHDTNVVELCFTTSEGIVKLTDAFIAMREEDKVHALFPEHEILRVVEGVSGIVKMKVVYAPRTSYGRKECLLINRKNLGIHFSWKEHTIILLSTLEPDQFVFGGDHTQATAEFFVKAGERIIFSLSYSSQCPVVLPELQSTALHRLQNTIAYWRDWINQCRYSGIYHEQVRRSALVLKLLAHAPSGSIIAAPTTSLPEQIGGERNWDYRYCWLRDASFTMRALVRLGFENEAHAYMNWILHATQLTRPELQVVYSVYGHSKLKEEKINWLTGYRDSRPVRIGNSADAQFQLDVYGEVIDAAFAYASLVKQFDNDSSKFMLGLGKVICKLWTEPDHGIWEIRSSKIHHTHSKVMAWVGLDRLIKLCEKYRWKGAPVHKFRDIAARIYREVEKSGYNPRLNSYTRELNGRDLDASSLTFSLVDYCSFRSSRMVSTVNQIYKVLSKEKLIYRYRQIDDGFADGEGAFTICNFWLAENLAHMDRVEEAVKVFETTLEHASPAGLLSEQIDPESHELLGNYPQGFSHIGLINAALSIDSVLKKKEGIHAIV